MSPFLMTLFYLSQSNLALQAVSYNNNNNNNNMFICTNLEENK